MNTGRTSLFQNRPRLWLIVAILLVASVLAVAVPLIFLHITGQQAVNNAHIPGTGNLVGATGSQSFSVGPNASLIVKEQAGDVSVYPGNSNTITIQPRKHGTTLAQDTSAVHILYNRMTNTQSNDQITVSTDPWFSTTDFYITIPDTTATQITLNSGSIDVHSGHGLTASTGSGGIALENISGPINAHTDSGDVTATNLRGPIAISASSGSLKLQQISGEVNAKTWSGDVIVRASALSGNSLLQTQNGSVRFDGSLDPHGSYTMQTTSGDVDLTLPGNAAFSLNASTGSGTVQNAFGTTVTGSAPRAQLSLHTQNGSIAVVKGS